MRIIVLIAALTALVSISSAVAAPAQPSCSYSAGVITVSDFPRNQTVILDVIENGNVTTEYWILFRNSTTFNVGVASGPTLYQFRKFTGQHDVIAECSS